jgi:2,3-diketo-5-methylthio-1-phosphopentane phosphatase
MSPTERALAKLRPPLAILCDFDDTTAVENVAEILVSRFGGDGWIDLREQFRRGRLTLRQYQEAAFSLVKAGRADMVELVKEKATLRPYFKELHAYCRKHDTPLAVVSNGLDFYVQALLEREGLSGVSCHTVVTRLSSDGMEFAYPYARKRCSDFGNCKCMVLEQYRSQGYRVLYVGDGRSDFCVATAADLVFARSDLARFCGAYGIDYVPFRDFGDVLTAVKKLAGEAVDD